MRSIWPFARSLQLNMDYNGYKNRSTWLAVLHLNNTNKEVYEEAKRLAQEEGDITPLSFLLWDKTGCEKEENYKRSDIDWTEVLNALRQD
jgi:hypothetical protein